jgi:hypothetical protein
MKPTLSRRHILSGASALAGTFPLPFSGGMAQETTLRVGHVSAPTHQFHRGI